MAGSKKTQKLPSSKRARIAKAPVAKAPRGKKPSPLGADAPRPRSALTFPVVGLGGSAGGLSALEEFFTHASPRMGAAFVVVTHQHPDHRSLLAELLARKTEMPVKQVTTSTPMRPNHVYTPAPGFSLSVHERILIPIPMPKTTHGMPIDLFFRSLAHDVGERAIAVVLSGTGTDGTLGIKEIKAELGMVLAQDERSAQYGGMPHSAISSRVVDSILAVADMPKEIAEYARLLGNGKAASEPAEVESHELNQVFSLIRTRTGHDFSHYKDSTVRRRIERRMNVHHLSSLKRYVRYLQTNPTEIDTLFKELLIGVTSFFRDPDAWKALEPILDESLASIEDGQVFRAWIPACSTGEEAYSLAMLIKERLEHLKRQVSVQIFATDLDVAAIDAARAGEYPLGITSDVSPERISKFFTREDQTLRVKKDIRELVVFAPQNLIGDPPFTKLDFLACRNLLIYLDAELQRRLLPIFHYALKPKGCLFLGSSESIGGFGDLFATLSKKWKVFRREDGSSSGYVTEFPMSRMREVPTATRTVERAVESNVPQLAERLFLKQLVPPTVLIHQRGDVVHIHGRTGQFLEPAPGAQASANIFNMVREGLQISLAAAMREAAGSEKEIVHRHVPLRTNGEVHAVDIKVQAIREPEALRGLFRVTFDDTGPAEARSDGKATPAAPSRMLELERELQYTKESHQGTIEELETANEELKSTNEEMQSTNEELQSANEELETSKEEMQSLNEELQTVNAELQGKVEELSRANNDMRNLLNGTDIATVFLDNDLNIKRFTEQAKRVIRLIPSDIGRPIADLVSTLRYDTLVNDAREVLDTLIFKETEVQSEGDASYLMRILPYRTTENVIEGLVLTFVDITTVRRLQKNQERLLKALSGSPTCVFGHDTTLRYRWAYYPIFGFQPNEVEGKTDAEIFGSEAAKAVVALKKRVIDSGTATRGRVELPVLGGRRTYDFYVEVVRDERGTITGISCVATEMS